MKTTTFITWSALSLLLQSALGQATFRFNNYSPSSSINAPVSDTQGNLLAGENYLAELWGGAAPDSLTPAIAVYSGQRVIIPFQSPAGAGYFRDAYVGRDGADHPSIFSVLPGGWAWLEVRAWDARLGATYEEVTALGIGGYGQSQLFYAQGGIPDPLSIGAPLFGLQSFSLLPIIPEPSSYALLAFGGALLWLFRRQRPRKP